MDKIQVQALNFDAGIHILDEAKDREEINEIVELARLEYPSPDLKLFKCEFLRTDEENRNGCTLPHAEVEKSLGSLVGKAVDLEHFRKDTIGAWVKAELEGNKVMAWGYIWASNFEEETAEILEHFEEGQAHVSFEAWGRKVPTDDDSYRFIDLHFCGGAILRKGVAPAYPNSKVLEFAKAKYGENVELISGVDKDKSKEYAKLFLNDIGTILGMTNDIECPTCKEKGFWDIRAIDLDNKTAKVKCFSCEAEGQMDFTSEFKETKKGKKPTAELVDKADELEKESNNPDNAEKATEQKTDGGKESMEEKTLEQLQEEIATLKAQVEQLVSEKTEIEEAKTSLETEKEELATKLQEVEEAKAAIEAEKTELKEKVDKYEEAERQAEEEALKEKAASRREELKDYLESLEEEISDETLLNDDKYEVFKTKAEIKALKEDPKVAKALEISGEKDKEEEVDPIATAQKEIDEAVKALKKNKRT